MLAAGEPFHLILDGVGGSLLGHVLATLQTGSTAVLYGVTGTATAEIGLAPFLFSGDGALQGFNLYHEARHEAPSRGLARLLALVQARKLDTFVTHTASWTEVRDVAAEYMTRKHPGKVVLVVD